MKIYDHYPTYGISIKPDRHKPLPLVLTYTSRALDQADIAEFNSGSTEKNIKSTIYERNLKGIRNQPFHSTFQLDEIKK